MKWRWEQTIVFRHSPNGLRTPGEDRGHSQRVIRLICDQQRWWNGKMLLQTGLRYAQLCIKLETSLWTEKDPIDSEGNTFFAYGLKSNWTVLKQYYNGLRRFKLVTFYTLCIVQLEMAPNSPLLPPQLQNGTLGLKSLQLPSTVCSEVLLLQVVEYRRVQFSG